MTSCQYQGGQVDLSQIETESVPETPIAEEEIPEAVAELTETPYETIAPENLYRYKAARNDSVVITQYTGTQTEVVIPQKIGGRPVTAIGEAAFWGNETIQSVTVPESVTAIGGSAFAGCSNLTDIMIPATVIRMGPGCLEGTPWMEGQTDEFVVVGDGVCIKYNGEPRYREWIDGKWVDAYEGPPMLIVIPEGVKMVTDILEERMVQYEWEGKYCQWDGVVLPESLEVIGAGAFKRCSFLSEITFPKGLKEIGDEAFFRTGLWKVDLPDELEYIGRYAFYGINLPEIVVPASVKMVGEYAFGKNWQLSDVIVLSENTWVHEDAFGITPYEGDYYLQITSEPD